LPLDRSNERPAKIVLIAKKKNYPVAGGRREWYIINAAGCSNRSPCDIIALEGGNNPDSLSDVFRQGFIQDTAPLFSLLFVSIKKQRVTHFSLKEWYEFFNHRSFPRHDAGGLFLRFHHSHGHSTHDDSACRAGKGHHRLRAHGDG
jgi:hypothetical protein